MRFLLLLALSGALCACSRAPELSDLGPLEGFEGFEDERGGAIGASALRGRPWVANFMFTSCPTSCPPLAEATAKLQERVKDWAPQGEGPWLVTVTVDPVTDTPERLRAFSQRYGADPALWRFARADYATTEVAVVDGFHAPLIRTDVGKGESLEQRNQQLTKPTPFDTAHSLQFVLIDAQGRLRGVFGREEAELERLDEALRHLWERRAGEGP
jgi:protein SCO1/2